MDEYLNRKKLFIRFLKENNCYQSFVKNYYKYTLSHRMMLKQENNIDNLIKCKIDGDISNEISHAFCWRETPQGHEYWDEICFKWRRIFSKKYN